MIETSQHSSTIYFMVLPALMPSSTPPPCPRADLFTMPNIFAIEAASRSRAAKAISLSSALWLPSRSCSNLALRCVRWRAVSVCVWRVCMCVCVCGCVCVWVCVGV